MSCSTFPSRFSLNNIKCVRDRHEKVGMVVSTFYSVSSDRDTIKSINYIGELILSSFNISQMWASLREEHLTSFTISVLCNVTAMKHYVIKFFLYEMNRVCCVEIFREYFLFHFNFNLEPLPLPVNECNMQWNVYTFETINLESRSGGTRAKSFSTLHNSDESNIFDCFSFLSRGFVFISISLQSCELNSQFTRISRNDLNSMF